MPAGRVHFRTTSSLWLELNLCGMMRPDMSTADKGRSTPAKGKKKPYQKPSFKFEKVFETMALACGKISATQQNCKTVKKNS